MKPERGRRESGFALLLVFAMAAAVAITLYMELPRVAFEAQRQREEMLIERGEQYQRAIQLYVRKNQRYPQKLDDLDGGGGVPRFLRRRYRDPMTGEEEWRLIHVGAGGVLVDSVVHKPASAEQEKKKSENTFITESLPVGSTLVVNPQTAAGGGVGGPAGIRGASDRGPYAPMPGPAGVYPDPQNAGGQTPPYGQPGIPSQQTLYPAPAGYPGNTSPGQAPYPGAPGYAGQTGYPMQPGYPVPPGFPVQPGAPAPAGYPQPVPGPSRYALPALTGQPPGVPQPQLQNPVAPVAIPGQPFPFPFFPGASPQTPGGNPAGQPGSFAQPPAGYPSYPGAPPAAGFPPSGTQSQYGQPYPQYPVAAASSQTGGQVPYPSTTQRATPGQGGVNPALQLIQNILMNPRPAPGGMQTGGGAQMLGGGIAGVASKVEAPSIKVYNERSAYNEWEFIYDPKSDKSAALAGATLQGAGASPMDSGRSQQKAPGAMPGFSPASTPSSMPGFQPPGGGLPAAPRVP